MEVAVGLLAGSLASVLVVAGISKFLSLQEFATALGDYGGLRRGGPVILSLLTVVVPTVEIGLGISLLFPQARVYSSYGVLALFAGFSWLIAGDDRTAFTNC